MVPIIVSCLLSSSNLYSLPIYLGTDHPVLNQKKHGTNWNSASGRTVGPLGFQMSVTYKIHLLLTVIPRLR